MVLLTSTQVKKFKIYTIIILVFLIVWAFSNYLSEPNQEDAQNKRQHTSFSQFRPNKIEEDKEIEKNQGEPIKKYELPLVNPNVNCSRTIWLDNFQETDLPENPLFFIETAEHSILDPRQSCSVESALRNSGRNPVILMSSPVLEPARSNATCQLLRYGAKFFKYNFAEFVKETPLEKLVFSQLEGNKDVITHASDMMRQVSVYKYGGMYLDLDFVILRDLTGIRNAVTMTNMGREYDLVKNNSEFCNPEAPSEKGHIQNAFVALDKGHQLPWKIMENLVRIYNGDQNRAATGPLMLTHSIEQLYQISPKELRGFKSANLTIFPTFKFFTTGAQRAKTIFNTGKNRSPAEWDEFFSCSYAVHFYSYISKHFKISGDPKTDTYSYLAPKHCPISYWSHKEF